VLVKDRMTPQPLVVVTPDTPIIEAQQLMQDHNIRHVPVVTEHQNLVGLLTREAMLQAMPWSASSLSVLETQYILSKVTAGKVMIRDVMTVTEDVAVEEAARIMVDHKIGCLPVLRAGALVGIITDIDLLSTTMEMLGARQSGLRLSVTTPDRVGEMAKLSAAIAAIGGNLRAVGSWGEGGQGRRRWGVVLKVSRVSKEQLMAAVEKLTDVEILDVREM
jgi:acetoin utilization protein AcuB